MNPIHNMNIDRSLAAESGNIQTQYASFQNFEQFSASGFSNAPIYITKPPGITALPHMTPHCSVLGPQSKVENTPSDNSIPRIESHSLAPTVRYVQAGQFEETPEYGVAGIPCVEPEYTDESVAPYCYTSEANFTGVQSTISNLKPFSGRPFNDNLNGTDSVADSQCRPFDSSAEFKLPQFAMSSLNAVSQGFGKKDEYIGGSENDLCSTMRWRDPNLSEVIGFLSNPNTAIKANAAAYLQHLCYMDDPNKQRTRSLGGIPPLVRLLSYDSPEIHKNACGALRNLSYGRQNDENKRGIKNAGGIDALVHLLCRSQETEVKELVTGVLWNMSSCEDLKRSIIDEALAAVVCNVIKPHSGWDAVCCGDTCFSTVFRNASGVLRNVSSAGEHARGCLRNCENLVECLLYVVRTAIEKNNIGNKTVENCVCILRNLSYRCQEVEDPNYDKLPFITPEKVTPSSSKGENLGCFGTSKKKKDAIHNSEALQEYNIATEYSKSSVSYNQLNKGYEQLWQPEVVQYYLSLLQSCSNPETLEAAAGAIQNLSACYWQPSIDIRATVRKEKGLPILVELLRMEVDRVVCAVATALRNLAIDQRNKELIGKYAMRDLVQKLPSGNVQHDQNTSDDTITAVLATINEVIKKNPEFSRSLLDSGGIDRLMNVTKRKEKYTSCVLKFASQVLYTMWQHNELRDGYKKNGWKEQDFISKSFTAHSTPPSSPNNANNTLNRPMASQGRTRYEDRTIQRAPSTSYKAKDSSVAVMSNNEGALLSEMVRKKL
ncbi:catenin delta-2 isoform X1 [Drosophila ficusphila]|uniref:catenin delta-2 isoform X1 n=1 Tax=Drosophila ficusphila TaxID=30025 RepID=UPI001C8940CA|nr:catenin delta-2 isoform X1 [Drosophila ficusphila]XP_043064358.1 catenin delta-2 isoform X1 [Drosophila ficusphila]